MRRVTVYWLGRGEKVRIGELAQARSSPIVFEWDENFLSSSVELSPLVFAKRPGLIECPPEPFDGLPGLFADHIPDGWGRILLRRGLREQGVNFDDISPLDMLQYIGDRAMGALSFEPQLERGESWAEGRIDLDRLEHGIEPILSGTPSAVLEEFLSAGTSPNGIRPKILAKEKAGKLYIGDADLVAPEWLIKFRAPGDSPETGKVEYIYSLLAKKAGLNVAESRLFTTKKGSFFATQRFDRLGSERVHMHTLSGILGVAPGNFAIGYDHFAKVAGAVTQDMREVEQVFRLAVFNVLAANHDDHARNVSFLMDKNGTWKVAPAYDLTFYLTQAGEHKMPIYGNGKPTFEHLRTFGRDLGLRKALVTEIVERTIEALQELRVYAKRVGVSKREMERILGVLQTMRAGAG